MPHVTDTHIQRVQQLVEDVKSDGWYIAHIKNPPVQVQIAAVKDNVKYIELIKNPAAVTRTQVIKLSDQAITYIDQPTLYEFKLHNMLWVSPKGFELV